MVDNRPIGLFDSGVGGLSILAEIKKTLPKESFVFLADQGHNPYGAKTPKQLQNLSIRITRYLLKYQIKAMVIACNTATCYAIDTLRSRFKIPIVGVVPAIKPATALTQNAKIAVMATPATARSAYLSSLVSKFASGVGVLKLGCEGLEESVEYLKIKDIKRLLDKYTREIKNFGADVIVLGCTHFPFVREDIQKRVDRGVIIIDSGRAIAKRVRFILMKNDAFAQKNSGDIYLTTGDWRKFSQVASKLLKHKIEGHHAQI